MALVRDSDRLLKFQAPQQVELPLLDQSHFHLYPQLRAKGHLDPEITSS